MLFTSMLDSGKWVHMLRNRWLGAFYSLFLLSFFYNIYMGYVRKWLIIEEFSIVLNHRILSEKWVGLLRIIQSNKSSDKNRAVKVVLFMKGGVSYI